jgi:hypothetical protein
MQLPTALFLVSAIVAGPAGFLATDDSLPQAEAPDGERGFGTGLDPKVLLRALRDPSPADSDFLQGLWALARDVEILGSVAAARYDQLGYFSLVDDNSAVLQQNVEALHRGFRESERLGLRVEMGDLRGLALARAMSDEHFLARMKVLVSTEYDVAQLRSVLTLLLVHVHGRAELRGGSELDEVTRRADLAAARLRAARTDLEQLYQPATPEAAGDPGNVLQLAHAFSSGGGGQDAQFILQEVKREANERELRLSSGSLEAFDTDHAELLQERYVRSKKAYRDFAEMLTILPLQADGRLPQDLEGKNSERYRQAADAGREAVRMDPLVPEIQYFLAICLDFYPGRELSLPRFDRYLALRGIRHWDYGTFRGRTLTDQELHALFVVIGWRPPKAR